MARLTHTPFDYPIRPYTMSLADYFMRALEATGPFGRDHWETQHYSGGRALASHPPATIE
ncbi:hypothetical protein CK203_042003 [Vitis vinifera]|uniref:Uncharacterized protein n=1 Tax=Vitis vinifera TaxID=29760 RepID=A0A438I0I5_VITVI|nr:hypothetical protein CK203_042003 [Vitis vinifera]